MCLLWWIFNRWVCCCSADLWSMGAANPWEHCLWAGSRVASFHLTVWFCLRPWTLTIPISVGGLQHALFLVSHLLLVYRHLQNPSPGWRDWKAAAIKIGDIYICMQFDLLTWSSVRFLGWSFPCVSASGTWADVTRLCFKHTTVSGQQKSQKTSLSKGNFGECYFLNSGCWQCHWGLTLCSAVTCNMLRCVRIFMFCNDPRPSVSLSTDLKNKQFQRSCHQS